MSIAFTGQTLHEIHHAHEAGHLALTVEVELPEGYAHDLDARTTTVQLAQLPYPDAETAVFTAIDWVVDDAAVDAPGERLDVTVILRDARGGIVGTPVGGDMALGGLLALLMWLRIAVEKAAA